MQNTGIKNNKMSEITMNKPTLRKLRDAYDQAVKGKKESFIFEGAELVTNYAKYLIEYMDGVLNKK